MKKKLFRRNFALCNGFILGLILSISAFADPIQHVRTESFVDWTSAGVAGVGPGPATVQLSGVSGTVQQAFLYWHGIGSDYTTNTVTINGNSVVGDLIGTATTNCWGSGNSKAYRADVTSFVSGNGNYVIDNLLSGGPGSTSVNGISLVVIYDDGDPTNDRDLAFFEGNDSNIPNGFPGEDTGWHASLSPINYQGGPVSMEFHLGDGQNFTDNSLTLQTVNGSQTIADTTSLWDGVSLTNLGQGRASNGGLWDIHRIDITAAFGNVPGPVQLDLDGMYPSVDCLGLIVGLVDLEPGTAPPPVQSISLIPREATSCTSDPVELRATLMDDDGLPISTNVEFNVISGPNVGTTATVATDANGIATWSHSSGVAGTDTVEACFVDNQGVEQCDLSYITWEVCNQPPVCDEARVSIPDACLWPPNHEYHNVTILGITDPDGDTVSTTIEAVTSDEKTAVELGAGGMTHSPDAILNSDGSADIRAERAGTNDGRVYKISGTADDGNNGQCTFSVDLQVPHHLEFKVCNAIDSRGPEYDATQ